MSPKPKYEPKRTLGVFTLGMINVAAIISLKNFPLMAEYGWTMFFYYGVAALGMFIPTALVSAELATAWPLPGGVYAWVREAFGKPTGFLAVWLQWVNNVPYFPSILGFFAVALAYTFFPGLEQNNY
ncbi:MAG: amino acid permease, partial [bacterium]|nr:amino acid permease [bacterium]